MGENVCETGLIDRFLDYLSGERGYSSATVAAYRADLRSVERHAGSLDGLTSAELAEYLRGERAVGRSGSTLRRRLAALRTFFHYAAAEGLVQRNILEGVDLPRPGGAIPKPLRSGEIEALLGAARGRLERAVDIGPYKTLSSTQRALRDLALLELLYAAGLRVSEAVSLEWSRLDLRRGYVRPTGKGRRQRMVPVGETALGVLKRYRDSMQSPKGADPVFCSRPGVPLRRNRVNRLLGELAAEAGLDRTPSPHQLRHSFATHLLAGGAGIRLVNELLGHSRLTETQRYTRVEVSRLERAHRAAHPRAKGSHEG